MAKSPLLIRALIADREQARLYLMVKMNLQNYDPSSTPGMLCISNRKKGIWVAVSILFYIVLMKKSK